MAHEIENNQIAYVGATPWHGLGVEVPAGTTGAEMLRIAKLDWEVEERDVYVADSQNDDASSLRPQYKAIVRSDNNHLFSIPSKRYEIVQNIEVVDMFREYCEAGHATMETVGGLRGGAVVWALAKLAAGATLKGDDKVDGYVLFCTSHDGSMPTLGQTTQVRVVCHNTLTAAIRRGKRSKGEAQFKMKHSSKWTDARKAEAQMQMGMATKQAIAFNETCIKLSNVTLTNDDTVSFVRQLLASEEKAQPEVIEPTAEEIDRVLNAIAVDAPLSRVGLSIMDSITNSPGSNLASAKGTLWGVVNGVSHYVDHQRGRTQDARLHQAWFGVGDDLKNAALSLALETAGITA